MDNNTKLIDGKFHAQEVLATLSKDIENLKSKNIKPNLAIIMVGNNPTSEVYVSNKIKKAGELGIGAELIKFPENIAESSVIQEIERLNENKEVHGIIVQLPLPHQISPEKIQRAISADKDVDGFNPLNVGLLYSGLETKFIACTPLGCLHLIKSRCENIVGKNIVVVGKSNIVGKPLASLLLRENATVTLCDSKTQNLAEITSMADIVVLAAGAPSFFGAKYFKEGGIVIDVGITKMDDGNILGDAKLDEAIAKVSYITPVPGGVGPMTIAYLMSNVVKACISQL